MNYMRLLRIIKKEVGISPMLLCGKVILKIKYDSFVLGKRSFRRQILKQGYKIC